MKTALRIVIITLLFTLAPSAYGATNKAGGSCPKAGNVTTIAKEKYNCQLVNKKLIWVKASKVTVDPILSAISNAMKISKLPVNLAPSLTSARTDKSEWLKESNKTVIIVFEGRDSAGKGSTIKKFTENLNPRYYNIIALGVPTPEDRQDWWNRYKKEIKPGMINLFDRSWYNRGLVEPVMGYGSPEEYEDFMENVEGFEMDLVKEGDYLFKLWFSIDKGTQKRRFDIRQQSPLKYWKYSPNDSKMQDLWDRFTEFKEKLFDKTSTVNHPWVIVDAEDKRVSGLNAIRYILQNIPYKGKDEKVLDKSYPEALAVLRPKS